MTFVDTSAFYAGLDRADKNHSQAVRAFERFLGSEPLVTHNYVVVETISLVHRRLGFDAARAFLALVLPAVELIWIDQNVHEAAQSALLGASRKRMSLVDWTSIEVMRRGRIRQAFAFDRDFVAEGFDTLP